MKEKSILIVAFTLLLIMSCDRKESINSWSSDQNTKQIVFFSDEEHYEQEISYYDAIIQLKQDYPEEVKNMKILSASEMRDYTHIFQINHCPALLVYYKDQVIVEIKGNKVTIDEIVTPIANVLSDAY
ncbi:small peptidoglycan-associated lipoprotein [Bacillus sp. V3B]|uniref:small peptidoglycan-associated lipoprotein n=1 Tax=Bacillus sp. V3B TaxID=2804915 RepID=UPI00210B3C4B|nr:small peptidoglycan-associated lipoprotein [Bacillus sp. V3B]MCQ6275111.1 small peptidoglycan-associated lipoprotein [Bacillus sp. V3B]